MKCLPGFLALAILIVLPGCADKSGPREITEVRELTSGEQEILIVESPSERFRMPSQMAGGGGGTDGSGAQSSGDMPFVWNTPEGWEQQTGRPMRDLSFVFGEEGEGECYLSRLPGAGGGLAANVNRWRGQMGQPALSEEDLAALPIKSLFGLEGTFIDVSGDFTGMGSDAKKDYRLLGVILTSEAGAVFVKMTGPAELVAANEAKFDEFCASLQPRQ